MGLSNVPDILSRIDSQYLNEDEDNAYGKYPNTTKIALLYTHILFLADDDLVDLLISVTRRVLVTDDTLKKDIREKLITESFERCTKLLQKKISRKSSERYLHGVTWYLHASIAPVANKELAKAGHMRLIGVLYNAALAHTLFVLDCDDSIATLLNGVQLRKTTEALQVRYDIEWFFHRLLYSHWIIW